jgi:MoxR-like ATPase
VCDPQFEASSSPEKTLHTSTLRAKLRAIRDSLASGLVERDDAIRLALLAALAGEHLLLLGPPGTAKSLLARRLHLAFAGSTYFERLLTRFTVPEELFGPLSIKALNEDRYERLTKSYLPSASIAFLDEIFKANSAILNALLTLLNEREFDNGSRREPVPLVAVIGASNELPQGEELAALYDRFLLRLQVDPVSASGFRSLLGLREETIPLLEPTLQLTPSDLAQIQAAAKEVEVPEDVVSLLEHLRKWCEVEKIQVSDRRWRKMVKLLQVSALTNDRSKVSIWDCWLLQHCVWSAPQDRTKAERWYMDRLGTETAIEPRRLTAIVLEWETSLASDREARSQVRDEKGDLLYLTRSGKLMTERKGKAQRRRGVEPLYRAPPELRNHSYVFIDPTNVGRGFTRAELDVPLYPQAIEKFAFGGQSLEAYVADEKSWFVEDVDLPTAMEPARYPRARIDDCISQIEALAADVNDYLAGLSRHMATSEHDIRTHLWVADDLLTSARTALARTSSTIAALGKRVSDLRTGFSLLPVEGPSIKAPKEAPPGGPPMSVEKSAQA